MERCPACAAVPLTDIDLLLILQIIDYARELDRLNRDAFGRDHGISNDNLRGMNALRAKIAATL